METNINYTLVGAFVVTLITAITVGIIWLSSGFSFQQYSTYLVYMQESVTGLDIDSPVEFNGVDVGTVKSVDLNHENPQLVELLLNIKSNTPITRGTVATLTTRGVTGVAYIALKDKSTDLRPLLKEYNQPYPVIRTAPSLFTRLDTTLSQLTANIHQVAESIQALLDKENLHSIKETLVNLRIVTTSLAQDSDKLSNIISNTEKASQQFAPLIQSGRGSFKILETDTLPAANRLLSTLEGVAQSMTGITAVMKQNPSVLIRGVDRTATLGPGERK